MKPKYYLFIFVLALFAMMLSGCAGRASLSNSWPGLATDGENAYLAVGQYVYAIRLSDGSEIWRYPDKANNNLKFFGRPVITPEGMVVVGSAGSDNRLVALDPERIDVETNSPEEAWIFTSAGNGWIAPPLLFDDRLFAPNTDGKLYVLDLQDGLATKVPVKIVELGDGVWAQPGTNGELIFITSVGHHLFALDAETYEFAWPAIDLGGTAPGSPLIGSDNTLYVGSFSAEMMRIDIISGTSESFFQTQNWVWGAPVTDGNAIYFGDLDGFFYAVDAETGELSWSIQPDGPIVGSPLMMPENIVFTTESGSVYAVTDDGKIAWQREVGGKIYTAPVSGSDRIVVAPYQADFVLAVLDQNGNQVWSFTPEN